MTPEQAHNEYYNSIGYKQWGTIAKHGKVKSIGHPKSFERAYDSKLAAGGIYGTQAYHFTNMKPNMRGAKALKFIAEHPGCSRREILDGIGLPPNYFSNFFTALKKTDLLDTSMCERNCYTLTKKGMALVDDIFNSPLHESGETNMENKLFESILKEEENTAYAVKVPVTNEGKVKNWAKILIALSKLGGTASSKDVYKMVYGVEREGSSQNGPFAALTRAGYMNYDPKDKKLHITSKGEDLIEEYGLVHNTSSNGAAGGIGAGSDESHGNLSSERLGELYRKLIEIFDDINQDGDYGSMERIIVDALHDSELASDFIARLGRKIVSQFGDYGL